MGKRATELLTTAAPVTSAKVSSSFAQRLLAKQGWKEGEALGKKKAGRIEPVQVKRRGENLGLGAEGSRYKWNEAWWENVFNSSVTKLQNVGEAPRKEKVKVA
mmetsp:Transcript_21947/g.40063  ORF Transcript_21947/g.40063 Transcript_21947/m.40063 type:complete len:103 (+) Transcript_21947:1364-1672(+)|eukprot:CAMPEP_0204898592 /NCGR_PEP_ID=MMETSP1397-20131031/1378_1 /ASSEMBLY_ACC=CAM_ASM_000891 /TAXON_ID=49980 /ORGANISM="Climacostomum Climacostomum virens, Strain Stock W-24" /LENGTH=102 /DNA_ID=CAMNT_0052066467 /DNA_START=1232 /DNA_END=1540 /DNA_ORIENTATION=-